MKKFIYIFLLFFIFAKPVYAYLDPGTGSYLFQILIAGALGALIFFKDIFRKIKQIFKIEKNEENKDE